MKNFAIGMILGLALVLAGAAIGTKYYSVLSTTGIGTGNYVIPAGVTISGTGTLTTPGTAGVFSTLTSTQLQIRQLSGDYMIASALGITVAANTSAGGTMFPVKIWTGAPATGLGFTSPESFMFYSATHYTRFSDGDIGTQGVFSSDNVAPTNAWSVTKCSTATCFGAGTSCLVSCPANTIVTGGGCNTSGVDSAIYSNIATANYTQWQCGVTIAPVNGWARCCPSN